MFDNAVSEQNARFRQLVDIYLNKNRDKSKQSIAQFVGCSASQFSKHYNGQREISLEDLVKYAELFGVTTDYMLCITDARSSDLDKRAICDYTGLSEDVIDGLHSNKFRPSYIMTSTKEMRDLVVKTTLERIDLFNLIFNELLYNGYVDLIRDLNKMNNWNFSEMEVKFLNPLDIMIDCLERSNTFEEYRKALDLEYCYAKENLKDASENTIEKEMLEYFIDNFGVLCDTLFVDAHFKDNGVRVIQRETNGCAYEIQQRFFEMIKKSTCCSDVDDLFKEYEQKVKKANGLLAKFI